MGILKKNIAIFARRNAETAGYVIKDANHVPDTAHPHVVLSRPAGPREFSPTSQRLTNLAATAIESSKPKLAGSRNFCHSVGGSCATKQVRQHSGIRSRSPPIEAGLEIYRTPKALGMEWKGMRATVIYSSLAEKDGDDGEKNLGYLFRGESVQEPRCNGSYRSATPPIRRCKPSFRLLEQGPVRRGSEYFVPRKRGTD